MHISRGRKLHTREAPRRDQRHGGASRLPGLENAGTASSLTPGEDPTPNGGRRAQLKHPPSRPERIHTIQRRLQEPHFPRARGECRIVKEFDEAVATLPPRPGRILSAYYEDGRLARYLLRAGEEGKTARPSSTGKHGNPLSLNGLRFACSGSEAADYSLTFAHSVVCCGRRMGASGRVPFS